MNQTTVTAVDPATKSMDDIVALCKRRGFIYPASEIYGGINGFWDFGPLGVELKNNLRDAWWRDMVHRPPAGPDGQELSIVGVDSAIIQNPRVWEASGHVEGFNDPMVDCRESKARYRQDHLFVLRHPSDEALPMVAMLEGDPEPAHKKLRKLLKVEPAECEVVPLTEIPVEQYARVIGPDTTKTGTLTEPRQFNLMFKTYVGATSGEDNVAYLRPETAQGIFTNFKNVLDTMRVKVPFGIAQIGKSFRNEVTPRNYIFRSREFEQMEMEWFCHPDEARKWYDFWVQARLDWWSSLGVDAANLCRRDHDDDELSHYSTACADVEYRYPFTAPRFGELEGVAHRGCYDLTKHQEHARTKLEYFDQEHNERYVPHVIEPAAGLTRGLLVLLCEAYTPDPQRPSKVFMKFQPRLAPIQAAVFPLVNKDGMPEMAERLYREVRRDYAVQFDVKQSIGKRYARMDEAGAPFCFTVDSDSLEDQTVTVRDRDTATQERIGIDRVESYLQERIE
ncbi:MAG: glycine--tRNA ligase [Planctomycetota bacterium]|jgi:glycyl-tRNA synthetase